MSRGMYSDWSSGHAFLFNLGSYNSLAASLPETTTFKHRSFGRWWANETGLRLVEYGWYSPSKINDRSKDIGGSSSTHFSLIWLFSLKETRRLLSVEACDFTNWEMEFNRFWSCPLFPKKSSYRLNFSRHNPFSPIFFRISKTSGSIVVILKDFKDLKLFAVNFAFNIVEYQSKSPILNQKLFKLYAALNKSKKICFAWSSWGECPVVKQSNEILLRFGNLMLSSKIIFHRRLELCKFLIEQSIFPGLAAFEERYGWWQLLLFARKNRNWVLMLWQVNLKPRGVFSNCRVLKDEHSIL